MIKLTKKGIEVKRCDNCGKINPPILNGNPRLCAACAHPKGFYKAANDELGADGKIGWWKLQLPFRIGFRSWWGL